MDNLELSLGSPQQTDPGGTESAGALQLNLGRSGTEHLETGGSGALDLETEAPRPITIRVGGGKEMTLHIQRGITERLDLGNSIPVPTRDYEVLQKKPKINGVELIGNKTSRQLLIQDTDPLTNLQIEAMLQDVFITEG